MPHSRAGRWSLKLAAVAAGLFVAFFGLVIGGHKGGDTFFSNPWLAGTITPAAVGAVAAAGVGLYAIVREGERAIAVYIATTAGFLVLAYTFAEIAFPH